MANPVLTHDFVTGVKSQPVSVDGETVHVRAALTLSATKAAGDTYAYMLLPADHVPVDLVMDIDDMDSGTSLTISAGIMTSDKSDISTAAADGGAAWIASSTGGQTGVIARPTTNALWRVTPSSSARVIGIKLAIVGSATAGTLGLTLSYRRSVYGT